jgi:hypothetical protein
VHPASGGELEPGAEDALGRHVAGLDELGEDPLGRTLGDADALRHLAQADVRRLGEAQEHLGVVGEEGPGLLFVRV